MKIREKELLEKCINSQMKLSNVMDNHFAYTLLSNKDESIEINLSNKSNIYNFLDEYELIDIDFIGKITPMPIVQLKEKNE